MCSQPTSVLMFCVLLLVAGTDNDICHSRPERVKGATAGTGRGFSCVHTLHDPVVHLVCSLVVL